MSLEYDDVSEEYEEYEEFYTFDGECICEHERESHGWGECGIDDCDCPAGWEE